MHRPMLSARRPTEEPVFCLLSAREAENVRGQDAEPKKSSRLQIDGFAESGLDRALADLAEGRVGKDGVQDLGGG